MLAYKFLRSGRTGPFSALRWPEPGVWVQAGGDVAPCRSGIHACRTKDLPWWLAEELWEVELRGELRADEHKIVATAGRLRRRVERWTPECAREYADACAWRARDQAVQALIGAQRGQAADRLIACTTLDEVVNVARRLAAEVPDTRIVLTMAGDGAARAGSGAAPPSAYIAAHAAGRAGGAAAYAAEREWQARWLVERLRLGGLG